MKRLVTQRFIKSSKATWLDDLYTVLSEMNKKNLSGKTFLIFYVESRNKTLIKEYTSSSEL